MHEITGRDSRHAFLTLGTVGKPCCLVLVALGRMYITNNAMSNIKCNNDRVYGENHNLDILVMKLFLDFLVVKAPGQLTSRKRFTKSTNQHATDY